MAKSSIIINTTNTDGKALQKTLTDINPEATSEKIVNFAQQLNNLTSNTYVGTSRVDKVNCDTEESGGNGVTVVDNRPKPTLSLLASAGIIQELKDMLNDPATYPPDLPVTYNGDGKLYAFFTDQSFQQTSQAVATTFWRDNQGNIKMRLLLAGSTATDWIKPCTLIVCATETENYKAPDPFVISFTVE